VGDPTERKYAQWDTKEPEMASDEKLRYKISPLKTIKMDAIPSGLSHWELEAKDLLRSDERKASNLGKR
jgi:hypothetical protein